MRKDLRLGLGIGALATVFAVTFLVVRNHTQNQQAAAVGFDDGEQVDAAAADEGDGLEANTAVSAPGAGPGSPPAAVVLPPLQPVPGTKPAAGGGGLPPLPKIAAEDPFARRQVKSGETPIPGPAARPVAGNGKPGGPVAAPDDWDLILANGRLDTGSSISGSSLGRGAVGRGNTTAVPPSMSPRTPTLGSDEATTAAAAGRPYTVREGETFSSIAKAVYGSSKYYLQIEQANRDVNPSRLRPGQEIVLPELSAEARASRQPSSGPFARDEDNRPVNDRGEYRVDAGDSLYRISMKLYGTPRMVDAIHEANRAAIGPNPERLRFGMILKLPRRAEHASGR